MPPRFPSRDLRPRHGSVSALLFENDNADVARDVFWSARVEFEPIEYRNGESTQTFACSAQVEWMRLGLRDWRQLEGRELRSLGRGEGFEASFYTTTHDWSDETRIQLADRQATSFELALDMRVDFSGWYEGDEEPAMPVSAALRVPFEGLMIYFDIVEPVPGNAAKVLEVAAPFVDLDAFGPPELRTNKFDVTAWWLPPRG